MDNNTGDFSKLCDYIINSPRQKWPYQIDKEKFDRLWKHIDDEWKDFNKYSTIEKLKVDAFYHIVGMGRNAIPFVLKEMNRSEMDTGKKYVMDDILVDLLFYITEEKKNKIEWTIWGKEYGYIQ